MAKKLWNVHTGTEHEGDTADHVYESPKDAMKVAHRYMLKASTGSKVPVQSLKYAGNARILVHDEADGKSAVVTPVNVRKSNFAFRRD